MVLLSILLGLQLAAATADHVPNLDIAPGCRAAAAVDAGETSEQGCLGDERAAHDALTKAWSGFASSDKTMCVDQTSNYNPSYVELLSCLEMMRDARIPYRPGLNSTPLE